MKSKILIIISTVAILHIFLGALMFTGGCETVEDSPMPPEAYVKTTVPSRPASDNVALSDPVADEKIMIPVAEESVTDTNPFRSPWNSSVNSVENIQPRPIEKIHRENIQSEEKSFEVVKYKVQKGDTLSKISNMYGVSVDDLADYNNISKKNIIRVGQTLTIPPGGKNKPVSKQAKRTEKKSEAVKTAPAATKKTAVEPIPADGIYTVVKNDSFYKIGAKFGVKAADIAAVNNLSLDKPLQIGQKLTIPKPGTTVTAAVAEPAKTTAVKKTETKPVDTPKTTVSPIMSDEDLLRDIQPVESNTAIEDNTATVTTSDLVTADETAIEADDTAMDYSVTLDESSTLEKVAEKYGCDIEDVKKLNPQLSSTGTVRAGTVIKLPLPLPL